MLTFRFANTKNSKGLHRELSGVTFLSNTAYKPLKGNLLRSIYYALYGIVNFDKIAEGRFLDSLSEKLSTRKSFGSTPHLDIMDMCKNFESNLVELKTPNTLRYYTEEILDLGDKDCFGVFSLMTLEEDGKVAYNSSLKTFRGLQSVENVIYIDDLGKVSDELHNRLTHFGKCDKNVCCLYEMICGQLFGSMEYDGVNRSFLENKRRLLSDSHCKVYATLLQLLKKGWLDDRTVLIIDRKSSGMPNARNEEKFHEILLAIHSVTGTKILVSEEPFMHKNPERTAKG